MDRVLYDCNLFGRQRLATHHAELEYLLPACLLLLETELRLLAFGFLQKVEFRRRDLLLLVEGFEGELVVKLFALVVIFLLQVETHGEEGGHLFDCEVLLVLEAVVDVLYLTLMLYLKLTAALLGAFVHECEFDVLRGAYGCEVGCLSVLALFVVDGLEVGCKLLPV